MDPLWLVWNDSLCDLLQAAPLGRVLGVLHAGPAVFHLAGQASRALSTARLWRSHALHLPPINVVVSHGPSGGSNPREDSSLEGLPT